MLSPQFTLPFADVPTALPGEAHRVQMISDPRDSMNAELTLIAVANLLRIGRG